MKMKPDIIAYLVMIIAVLILTGCGGAAELEASETTGADEEPTEVASVFEVMNLQENKMTAYVHYDHWHGGIPWIKKDESIALGTYIKDQQDNEIVVNGSQYAINALLKEDGEILNFECHGDHFYLKGAEEGETQITLQLLKEGDIYYETPPISVRVYE